MSKSSRKQPKWLAHMHPDYVETQHPFLAANPPVVKVTITELEESSEEEYSPADPLPADAQPEEEFSDGDDYTPASPPPKTVSPINRGKRTLKTVWKTVFGKDLATTSHDPEPKPSHQLGESPQTPNTSVDQTLLDNPLSSRIATLEGLMETTYTNALGVERRVENLEDEERADCKAIETLYLRTGKSHAKVNSMGAQVRTLQDRVRAIEKRVQAAKRRTRTNERRTQSAEEELARLQEQHNELVSYLVTRFGST